jgi:hypothetical protein
MLMNPEAIGSSPGTAGAATDLASPAAQEQAAQFDQLIQSVGAGLMTVALDDLLKLANEDV